MKKKKRILEPPEEVKNALGRQEVLRAWIDGGMLSVTICHDFPDHYRDDPAEIWGMLISDIFHHVADAIVLETSREPDKTRNSLRESLDEVFRSGRDSRHGILKIIPKKMPELPDPDVTGDKGCVEIVRIVLFGDAIRVMVLVGMWLPDEEAVWGNILYDIAAMVLESLDPHRDAEMTKSDLFADIFHYIDQPSSNYSGEYYNTEQRSNGNSAN